MKQGSLLYHFQGSNLIFNGCFIKSITLLTNIQPHADLEKDLARYAYISGVLSPQLMGQIQSAAWCHPAHGAPYWSGNLMARE